MMLIEMDHDAVAAETDYRLARASRLYDDRRRGRHFALRAAASRLRALSHRSGGEATRPAGVAGTASAAPHHVAAH